MEKPLKRIVRLQIAVVALATSFLTACGDSPLGPEFGDPRVEAFAELVNAHRVGVGCDALLWRADVTEVARAHSADMIDRDYFSHTNPDGDSPFDRLTDAGIEYSRAAENIAHGYADAEAVLAAWLDSPGHRANIENCQLREHGVGLVESHWTHVFMTSP